MALNLAALIMSYQVSVSPFAILATQQLRAVLPKAQAEKSPKVGKKSQFFQNKIPIKIPAFKMTFKGVQMRLFLGNILLSTKLIITLLKL